MNKIHPLLKTGALLLSFWVISNLIIGLVLFFIIAVSNENAPALTMQLTQLKIRSIDPTVLATVNAVAVLFNACVSVFCGTCLLIVWRFLIKEERWAFWLLLITLCFLQISGFISDAMLGNKYLIANIVSSLFLIMGFICSSVIFVRRG
jgi:hypothetical protein